MEGSAIHDHMDFSFKVLQDWATFQLSVSISNKPDTPKLENTRRETKTTNLCCFLPIPNYVYRINRN